MKIPVENLGGIGIIRDTDPHQLPPNVFSDGGNVKFSDGAVERTKGYAKSLGSATLSPVWLMPMDLAGYWVVATETRLYAMTAQGEAVWQNATSAGVSYTWTINPGYTGGVIGGLAVVNNSIDIPQYQASASACAIFQPLPGWSATWRARVMRVYKNYLVALGFTRSASFNSRTIKWSDASVPGNIPASWDEADPTTDAGEFEFAETEDPLIDCLPMDDFNIIYKQDTTWRQALTGDDRIFTFDGIFRQSGILSTNCVAAFDNQHVVLTTDDVVIHNGVEARTLIESRFRKWLFSNIDIDNANTSFIIPHYAEHEIWVCIPIAGSSGPTVALVWNYRQNTWGTREIPESTFAAAGATGTQAGGDWDSDSESWDSDVTSWQTIEYPVASPRIVVASKIEQANFVMDTGRQFNGLGYTSYVERTGLGIAGVDPQGNPIVDTSTIKYCRGLYPRITGGGTVNFYVGSQENADGTVAWKGPYPFIVGSDYKIDVRVTGRLLAYRIEASEKLTDFRLSGITWDVDRVGLR